MSTSIPTSVVVFLRPNTSSEDIQTVTRFILDANPETHGVKIGEMAWIDSSMGSMSSFMMASQEAAEQMAKTIRDTFPTIVSSAYSKPLAEPADLPLP